MAKTTELGLMKDIRRKCQALGTWRDEFETPARRLARIYLRLEKVEAEYKLDGERPVVEHTNQAGATNYAKNPLLAEIESLYAQALQHERELGLTPAALRKINAEAIRGGGTSAFAAALNKLSVV